jgi:hypothetical protein
MDPRERIKLATSHRDPDKLPVDFGSSVITGIHVSIVYKLRQYFGLDDPNTPVKVTEPYQMLGEIKDDLKEKIGIDATLLDGKDTFFGISKENWKEWKLFDGTPVLVPGLFNTEKNDDGSIYQYPRGDKNYPPSAKMPAKGFFFDAIIRQKPIVEEELDPKDNTEEFTLIKDKDLEYLKKTAIELRKNNNYAINAGVASSGFGDIAWIPGPFLKEPKGIRDIEEWYISTFTRKDYVKEIFSRQCEIALENYRKVNEVLGQMIDIVMVTGTDFGTQTGTFVSLDTYRELYKPFHKKINDWIHNNTDWKCFIHTDGAIYGLIPDFIDAGFEILNPIQISAKGVDPVKLKKEYGDYLTFWGAGVDTQKTLPLGNTDDVKNEVRRLIETFSPGGGFVFSGIHNIQANVPFENVLAIIEVLKEYR